DRSRTRATPLQFTTAKHRHRARRWRRAFSSMHARIESLRERGRTMSLSKSGRRTRPWRDTAIPRRPLLWLAAALLFTLPPMLGNLASWVAWFFLLALALKFWMEPRGYRLRSNILKLILAGLILGAIFLSYGTLKGIEPGVSLLAVLVSLKILEAHTAREFQVIVMMAWVLCLCGFLLS